MEITANGIQEWLITYLVDRVGVDPDEVDVAVPFDEFGLDSEVVVELTGELEDFLGRRLSPTLAFEYPTIEELSQHLASA